MAKTNMPCWKGRDQLLTELLGETVAQTNMPCWKGRDQLLTEKTKTNKIKY
jgi:hypothetical protein